MDLNFFLGVSMVPLDQKNEVRKIKSENLNLSGLHINFKPGLTSLDQFMKGDLGRV